MGIAASIKFIQGATIGTPGVSLFGVLSTPVDVTNGDDTGVIRWKWSMVSVPPGSAVPLGLVSDGATTTFQFVPDMRGGYEVELIVYDRSGTQKVDRRVFQIKELSERYIPPFSADAAALNFLGQLRGWSPAIEAYLYFVDLFSTAAASVPMTAGSFVQDVDGKRVYTKAVTVQTPDATPVELLRYTLPPGSLAQLSWIIEANSDTPENGVWPQSIAYRRVGTGAPADVGGATPTDGDIRPAVPWVSAPAASLDGNDFVLTATGDTSNIRWGITFQASVTFDPT